MMRTRPREVKLLALVSQPVNKARAGYSSPKSQLMLLDGLLTFLNVCRALKASATYRKGLLGACYSEKSLGCLKSDRACGGGFCVRVHLWEGPVRGSSASIYCKKRSYLTWGRVRIEKKTCSLRGIEH